MSLIDWIIVGGFLTAVTVIGFALSARNTTLREYFLAGRTLPAWLLTLSLVGASISAGTFVGAPQFAFAGNLSYLMLGVGGVLGGIITARVFVPALYHANTATIYGLLGLRYGPGAATAASVVFLLGQLLTAGARLYIAAIAVAVMLFNDISTAHLILSILLLGVLATIHTVAGGIRALVYIDALGIVIILSAGLLSIIAIGHMIPGGWGDIFKALKHAPGGNKLTLLEPGYSFTQPYNFVGALVGFTFFKIAQYGTDHEFAQRVMASRSVRKAARSLVSAQLVSLPIVGTFLFIGLLLHIFYARPEIMGGLGPAGGLPDSRELFPYYVRNHFPPGLLGLTVVGLLAAALASFNSAINAMASSVVNDLMGAARSTGPATWGVGGSRVVAAAIGACQTGFAILALFMQAAGGQNLVDFALGVMSFGYAGLLGVFACALFTRRGNVASTIAAFIAGGGTVYLLQPQVMKVWTLAVFGQPFALAWTWWVVTGGLVSFGVCAAGSRSPLPATPPLVSALPATKTFEPIAP